MYFKNKNIAENITIDADVIKIENSNKIKYQRLQSLKLIGQKINFYKHKNLSSLTIRQSSQEEEIAPFLHSDLKENFTIKLKTT